MKSQLFFEVLKTQFELLQSYFIFSNGKSGGDFKYHIGTTILANGEKGKEVENEKIVFGTEASSKIKNRLIAVQSFLYVSTEPHHWLVPAFDWCENEWRTAGKINAIDFINKLESIDNELIRSGRNISSIDDISTMNYKIGISRYWFYRLDYELLKLWVDGKTKQLSDDPWKNLRVENENTKPIIKLLEEFRFRSGTSIEHIYPRKSEVLGETLEDGLLHSFGNLALISTSRNSRFSNGKTEYKKQIILDWGYADSLKMLHFLFCESDIRKSSEMMHQILLKTRTDSVSEK